MKTVIHHHPVTSRLFGIGLPGWAVFATVGWALALILAVGVVLAVLIVRGR